jgi:hypothetical protein
MNLDYRFSTRSDGTKPDPTASKLTNAAAMAVAVVFRRFPSAKQQPARRKKRMTTVTIWSAVHNRPLKPMQWHIFDRLKDAAYPPAIVQLKAEGALEENCGHRPVQYLNNVLEQDHRAIKRRVRASQHFRSFWGAWRTIAGYEAIRMIRKGQAW